MRHRQGTNINVHLFISKVLLFLFMIIFIMQQRLEYDSLVLGDDVCSFGLSENNLD